MSTGATNAVAKSDQGTQYLPACQFCTTIAGGQLNCACTRRLGASMSLERIREQASRNEYLLRDRDFRKGLLVGLGCSFILWGLIIWALV